MDPLIINAAITGMVPRPEDNPAVPVSVDEIVADAQRCAAAGASILHVHARDPSGRPTWHAEVYARIIDGIRAACPDILISASTSGRLWSEFNLRAAALDCRPDFGSLTPGSMNFPTGPSINSPEIVQQLARAMNERGVVPELEFFDLGMVDYVRDYLLPRGFLRPPLYANLMLGSLGTAAATPHNLIRLVEALPPGTTWSAAGIGRFQFPMNCLAVALGGHVRVGLEDNLWMDPEKTDLATNVRLIQRVARVAEAMARPVATPAQTRRLIGLPTDHRLGRC